MKKMIKSAIVTFEVASGRFIMTEKSLNEL